MKTAKRLFAVLALITVGGVLISGCDKSTPVEKRNDNTEQRPSKRDST
jgi:PBP1b-binding outer membrane lipoprotein LpoB